MSELIKPMLPDERHAAITKTAHDLHLTAFSQYMKYLNRNASFEENLYTLLMEQSQIAFQKRVKRRVQAAGFPYTKTINMFKLSKDIYPNLDINEVQELTNCQFIKEKIDVCAFSPSGHGKTHLALAIGYEAIKMGFTVKFRRASDLINEMAEAKSEKKLSDYMRMMTRCSLLVIDEIGYLDYDAAASSHLFQIIGARYETGSTFYTSNQMFSEWGKFIGNDNLANAIVSRIAHHAILLDMNGPMTWRLENAKSRRTNT